MENLKIKVNSIEEGKEAQELFFELGFGWHAKGKVVSYLDKILSDYFGWLVLRKPSYLTKTVIQVGSGFEDCKEITLPQLRDMVVLKRNDPKDATHIRGDGKKYFHAKSTDYYYQFSCDKEWLLSTWMNYQLLPQLKPIEKQEMKEYLDKDYVLQQVKQTSGDNHVPSDWIEVPKGAEILTIIFGDKVFYKSGNPFEWFNKDDQTWVECASAVDWDGFENKLWQRSLNDKVASAEVARQEFKSADNVNNPSHYNKGGIECIDAIQSSMTKEAFCGYLKGSVQKYMWRYENKGGVESLQKAQWYLNKLIEVEAS